MTLSKLKKFQNELIASITAEDRRFNMDKFKTGGDHVTATCGTASCMAGHIQALRPKRAKELAKLPEYSCKRDFDDIAEIEHDLIAEKIWEEETGQKCRLDFFGWENTKNLYEITREEAVSHILGKNKDWPLL